MHIVGTRGDVCFRNDTAKGVNITEAFARYLVIFGVRPIKGHMYLSDFGDLGISRGIRYLLFGVVPNAFVNYRKHVSSYSQIDFEPLGDKRYRGYTPYIRILSQFPYHSVFSIIWRFSPASLVEGKN